MRGRPTCPTGQKKYSVGATAGSPLFLFLQGKVGYWIAPSSDPASPAHLWFMVASPGPDRTVPRTVRPPRGRLWGWESPFLYEKPPPPARPAGGRAVTGVRYRAAGQEKKEGEPPQGPPKLEKVGPGRKKLFLPGVLSSGFLPKKAGLPAGVGGAPGALRPKVASELPTRRVHTPPSRERNPSSPPAQPPDILPQKPQAEVLPLEPGGHLGRVPLADALGV